MEGGTQECSRRGSDLALGSLHGHRGASMKVIGRMIADMVCPLFVIFVVHLPCISRFSPSYYSVILIMIIGKGKDTWPDSSSYVSSLKTQIIYTFFISAIHYTQLSFSFCGEYKQDKFDGYGNFQWYYSFPSLL